VIVALVLGLILVGVAVTAIVRGLALPSSRSDVVDQIGLYGFGTSEADEPRGARRSLGDVATSLGDVLAHRRRLDESALRSRLTAGGMYGLSTRTFIGYQVLGAAAFGGIWIVIGVVAGMGGLLFVVGIPISVLFGWYLPSMWLNRKVAARTAAIDKALPELIDLLVVAVEAGMGFVAALRLTSHELEGPLAQELHLTLQEQTMGLSTTEALEGMARRADTPGMRAFVRGVSQGEVLGVSIGQILRNLSAEMRKRRKAMAEERAHKAPVKMLFPLVLLIFPALFVVLLLPAIITIARTLGE
jgi:tight adherence protein C